MAKKTLLASLAGALMIVPAADAQAAGSPSNYHSCDPVHAVELRAGAATSCRTARAVERRNESTSNVVGAGQRRFRFAGRAYRCKTNGDWYTLCRAGSIRSGRWVYISHSGELPGR